MRRVTLLTLLAAAVIVTVMLLTGRRPAEMPPPEVAATPELPAPDPACRLACSRLQICGRPPAGKECLDLCAAEWNEETRECVQQAACREIDERCFPPETVSFCEQICERLQTCWFFDYVEECLFACEDDWDYQMRACLAETPCEEAETVCFPAREETPCAAFCDRLSECGLIEPEDTVGCLDFCVMTNDPEMTECADNVPCEDIEPICLADDYDPLCLIACERLTACEALDDLDAEACPAVCMAEWDDPMLACLLDAACGEMAPICLGVVDPDCREACDKLAACDLEYDPVECGISCTLNMEPNLRQCILETRCRSIDTVCFGAGPDPCEIFCDKLVFCGFESNFDACVMDCREVFDQQLVGCVLAFPCETMEAHCFAPPM